MSETEDHGGGIMRQIVDNQRGAFVVIFAVSLLVILGFVALGIEAGRWYLVRAELAKGVDSAALAGAKNISNPYVTPTTIAVEFGRENFEAGYVGTPQSGAGTVRFTATMVESDKISVTGNVDATAILARIFGFDRIPVVASGVAQKKEVEIMMILDRSGSMDGSTKIGRLKTAASSFVNFFQDTQDKDKMGLITFATSVRLDFALGNNYVNNMRTAINAMCPGNNCEGGTNMESALDRADGTGGFTDQTGVPGDRRIQQFVVFFTDGQPTCFGGTFRNRGNVFDAAVCSTDNCRPGETCSLYRDLGRLDREDWRGIDPLPTGHGLNSNCCRGWNCWNPTTKWYIFETRPAGTYAPEYCNIPSNLFNGPNGYVCRAARDFALQHAQELKDKGIRIYTIGLGSSSQIDAAYLRSLSSGDGFAYVAPTSGELEGIFNRIARDIKLRLVY